MSTRSSSLVNDSLLEGLIDNWKEFLAIAVPDSQIKSFELHERTGRPLGGNDFIEKIESILGISLKKKRAGRKRK
ncbi:MAG: transposase, partial [Candidatus Helarchaeota archaeon]